MRWFSRASWHDFTVADRAVQLAELERHCDDLADLFGRHDDQVRASLFHERAEGARALLAQGYEQADLNDLAGSFPPAPGWQNARYADSNGPLEPWQEEIARVYGLAASVAVDLRAVAARSRP